MKSEKEIEKYKIDIVENKVLVDNKYLKGFVDALLWVLE